MATAQNEVTNFRVLQSGLSHTDGGLYSCFQNSSLFTPVYVPGKDSLVMHHEA